MGDNPAVPLVELRRAAFDSDRPFDLKPHAWSAAVPTVRISANVIRWPQICPCCSADADARVEVTSTRYTGTRVVRSQTKGWELPYCRACLRHVDAADRINSLQREIDHSRQPGNYHLTTVLTWVVAGLLCVMLGCCGALFSVKTPAGAVVCAVLALALLGGAVGLSFVTVGYDRRSHEEAVRHWKRRLADMKDELSERKRRAPLFRNCAAAGRLAVGYEGWHGTVHTFVLDSPRYADRFRQANRGKIIG
jgi:hypothetical protein